MRSPITTLTVLLTAALVVLALGAPTATAAAPTMADSHAPPMPENATLSVLQMEGVSTTLEVPAMQVDRLAVEGVVVENVSLEDATLTLTNATLSLENATLENGTTSATMRLESGTLTIEEATAALGSGTATVAGQTVSVDDQRVGLTDLTFSAENRTVQLGNVSMPTERLATMLDGASVSSATVTNVDGSMTMRTAELHLLADDHRLDAILGDVAVEFNDADLTLVNVSVENETLTAEHAEFSLGLATMSVERGLIGFEDREHAFESERFSMSDQHVVANNVTVTMEAGRMTASMDRAE